MAGTSPLQPGSETTSTQQAPGLGTGALLQQPYEQWRDQNIENEIAKDQSDQKILDKQAFPGQVDLKGGEIPAGSGTKPEEREGFWSSLGTKAKDVIVNQIPKIPATINSMLPDLTTEQLQSYRAIPRDEDVNDPSKFYSDIQHQVFGPKLKEIQKQFPHGGVEAQHAMADLAKERFGELSKQNEAEIAKQDEESRQLVKNVVNSRHDVHSFKDLLSYTGGLVGQAAGSSATIVAGPFGPAALEMTSAYEDGMKKAMEVTGKSRREIEQSKDLHETLGKASLAVGAANGILETVGLGILTAPLKKAIIGKIAGQVIKQGMLGALKNTGKGALAETVTEGTQNLITQITMNHAAGKDPGDINWDEFTENIIGGAVGGTAIGGASSAASLAIEKSVKAPEGDLATNGGAKTESKVEPVETKNQDQKETALHTKEEFVAKESLGDDGKPLSDERKQDLHREVVKDKMPGGVDEGSLFTDLIAKGEITADRAIKIIESAGLKVPNEISELAKQEQAQPENVEAKDEPVAEPVKEEPKAEGQIEQKAEEKIEAPAKTKITVVTEKGGAELKDIVDKLDKNEITKDEAKKQIDELVASKDLSYDAPAPATTDTGTVDDTKPGDAGVDSVSEQPATGNVQPTGDENADKATVTEGEHNPEGSGIKKATVPEEKQKEVEGTIDKKTKKEFLEQAKEDVDTGKIKPKDIVDGIVKNGSRALQPEEVSALVYYKGQLDNEFESLHDQLGEAQTNNDTEQEAVVRAKLESLQDHMDDYHEMSVRTAYSQSIAFGLRKMLLDSDYNLQTEIRKYKEANEGEIPGEVEAKFKDMDKRLREATAKIEELEAQRSRDKENTNLEGVKQAVAREKKRRGPARGRDLMTEGLKNLGEGRKKPALQVIDFLEKLKIDTKNTGMATATILPVTLPLHVWNASIGIIQDSIKAGVAVSKAVDKAVKWLKDQGHDFDEKKYRAYFAFNSSEAPDALRKVGQGLMDEGLATEDNLTEKMREYVKTNLGEDNPAMDHVEDVAERIKAKIPRPEIKDGKLHIPKKIIHDLVAGGVEDIEELTDIVHKKIQETRHDITHREVRDAITDYGKTSSLSQDEVKTKVRELKRVGKILSALEDVRNKLRPLRSGLQRDRLTDEERRLQKQLKDEMKTLPEDETETQRTWKTALDAIKAKLQNQIADLEHQIETGEKSAKKKGVEYDAEALALKDQRDKLKEIVQDMEGKPEMTDEQRVKMATAAVEKSIKDYERRIRDKDFVPATKKVTPETPELIQLRAERDKLKEEFEALKKKDKPGKTAEQKATDAAIKATEREIASVEEKIKKGELEYTKRESKVQMTADLEAARARLKDANATLDKMREDAGVAEQKRSDSYKARLKEQTEEFERRLKEEDFTKKEKRETPRDKEIEQLLVERERIKSEFDVAQEKNRLSNRSMGEKMKDLAMDVWNLPKSMLSTLDFSAPFRQGALLSFAHPSAGGRAFVEMFSQSVSQRKYEDWLHKVKLSPYYPLIRDSKLYLAEPSARLTAKEEAFMSNLAQKIPGFGFLVRASERAYTAYLNKLRLDVFSAGADRLRSTGMSFKSNPEAFKAWADYVNNATGRGNLGGLDRAAGVLNGLFFSPRYLASRFNILNPVVYAKMPLAVRKMAMRDTLTYISFTTMMVMLAGAAGAEVEWDPRSTDFGKIRIGSTRYDLWAGFQPLVRVLAQLASGQKKSTKTGKINALDGKKWGSETRLDVIMRFLRSKLSPAAGAVVNLSQGKDMLGNEVTIQGEAIRNVIPLYVQDMADILDKEGAVGVGKTALPAMFGVGVQTYGGEKKKDKN